MDDDYRPTTVILRGGVAYQIPVGERGTYRWVRQASLISVAYTRDMHDSAKGAAWHNEYLRRLAAWNAIEATRDKLAVLTQLGADLLLAPLRIAMDVGGAVVEVGRDIKDTAFSWAKWLPILLLGGLVVVGVGLHKGSLRVSR